VRDLWSLRVGLVLRENEGKGGFGSGTGTMMFSSQSEAESTNTDGTGGKSLSSRRSKKSSVADEKLPRLVETLGLCYLAMVLRRLPTSLGEIYKWATHDEITYTRAVSRPSKSDLFKNNKCLIAVNRLKRCRKR